MAVSSITTTKRWQCVAARANGDICGTIFDDPTSSQPCPACGNNDDNTIEPYAPTGAAAVGTVKKVPPVGVKTAKARPSLLNWDRVPGWLIGSALLGLWWAIGGKYTIEGLPLLGNLVFGWFHVPIRVAPITDGMWYLRLFWIPLLISFVERQYRPWRRRDILSRERLWLLLLWLVTIGIDAGSTFLAIRNPAPDAWTLTQQVAAAAPLALIWAFLTTFGPESGLSWLWKWLRGA
jgi:hypothetical protein